MSHCQMPTAEVRLKTTCMVTKPLAEVSSPNPIHAALDARNSTNPYPDQRLFRASSAAPETPRKQPNHSRKKIN